MHLQPKAIFFDMDHTLIDNDCDVSWKEFLLELGIAPADSIDIAQRYYEDYLANRLNADDFMRWQLAEVAGMALSDVCDLAQRHFCRKVKGKIYQQALALVRNASARGLPTAIITTTNSIVAAPVAEHFGIDTLLATEIEIDDGRLTGGIIPPYMTGEIKLQRAEELCRKLELSLCETAYFGDAPVDIPLLSKVGFANVVNPKPQLLNLAASRGWRIHTFTRWDKKSARCQ